MDLFSSWSESALCPAGLKILTTWTVWPDPLPKITWGQMRRQRERRRRMEATVSRAPQKSLAREGLKRERGGITSYLVKVLPWLKLIDMFGANVSKVCRQGGVGGLHISRLKVEKSGKCGSQGEPSDFNDSRCLGNWSQPDSVWTSHSSAQPFFFNSAPNLISSACVTPKSLSVNFSHVKGGHPFLPIVQFFQHWSKGL